jgi:tyrosine-protein phosphatase YwqE
MASQMNGVRGRTVSRTNTARVNATRLGFIAADIHSADYRRYGWEQESGPLAIEDTVNWQEESR